MKLKLKTNKRCFKKLSPAHQEKVIQITKQFQRSFQESYQKKNKNKTTQKTNKTIQKAKTHINKFVVAEYIEEARFALNYKRAITLTFYINPNQLTKQERKFFKQLYQISEAKLVKLLHQIPLQDPRYHSSVKVVSEIRKIIQTKDNNPNNPNNNTATKLSITLDPNATNQKNNPKDTDKDNNTPDNTDKPVERKPLVLVNQ